MPKNIVICLDGTNNTVEVGATTNVLRLFELVELGDRTRQVGYYDPGVGTFSSPAAWSPPARALSQWAGLAFGAGLRQNLGEAYSFLTSVYEDGDRIFLFGFSRGAYTARALAGMLEVFGVFRPGTGNVIPYAVSEMTRRAERSAEGWEQIRLYGQLFARRADDRVGHTPIHFVGLWDTVKAAGTLRGELRWPWTRRLPHAMTVRHAVAIDEERRPYVDYLVHPPEPHVIVDPQDLQQVWFAGVHSDVGGMFPTGSRLSDIPLKWMAEQAVGAGLLVRGSRYDQIRRQVSLDLAVAPVHRMTGLWRLVGARRRTIAEGSLVHASVRARIAAHPEYAARLPSDHTVVDRGWATTS